MCLPSDAIKHRQLQTGSLSTGERSYPTSEVRGSGLECQAAKAQGRLRGAALHLGQWQLPGGDTTRPRSGAARRSHLAPEARGGDLEEPPRARGQGQQLVGATHAGGQGQRPEGATRGVVAAQAQEGLEELSHVEDQEW